MQVGFPSPPPVRFPTRGVRFANCGHATHVPGSTARGFRLSFRTLQHTGHPHPVLVLDNLRCSALITTEPLLNELEARLLPAMSPVSFKFSVFSFKGDAEEKQERRELSPCFFDLMVDKLRCLVEDAGVGDGGQEDAPEKISRTHVCTRTTRTRCIHGGVGTVFDN
jgi:hypothetical protein